MLGLSSLKGNLGSGVNGRGWLDVMKGALRWSENGKLQCRREMGTSNIETYESQTGDEITEEYTRE